MTKQEKQIVSAYTGILMCDWESYKEYTEELLGREIMTHEYGDREVMDQIKDKAKPAFLELCDKKTPAFGN